MKNHIQIVEKLAQKLGFIGKVNEDNVKEIVVSLAENHAKELEEKLVKMYDHAVKMWEFGNNGAISQEGRDSFTENYDLISGNADKILSYLGIVTDYPGLYPSFLVKIDGKEYFEYTVKNALRRFNYFWK